MLEVTRIITVEMVVVGQLKDDEKILPKEDAEKLIKTQLLNRMNIDAVTSVKVQDFIKDGEES